MISTEIYIENQRLDLYKDISAEFTYAIDDIKDFSSRNTNFSKTIVIPGNATINRMWDTTSTLPSLRIVWYL